MIQSQHLTTQQSYSSNTIPGATVGTPGNSPTDGKRISMPASGSEPAVVPSTAHFPKEPETLKERWTLEMVDDGAGTLKPDKQESFAETLPLTSVFLVKD